MFYPLEFCRTRITADTTPAGQPRANAGIVHCLRTAWAQEGILSWYKGLGLSLPGVVMYTSTSLLMYDEYKVWHRRHELHCVVCMHGKLIVLRCPATIRSSIMQQAPESSTQSCILGRVVALAMARVLW